MYHSLQSVYLNSFFITDGQWHKIDNIGAIMGFSIVMVLLMDNRNRELDLKLNCAGLFIVILCQEKDPWNFTYTIFPICLFVSILLITLIVRPRKPTYNKRMAFTAFLFGSFATVGFAKGMDEDTDYLRMYHGMWHLMIGIFSFYIWQMITPVGEEFTWSNLFSKVVVHPPTTKYAVV